MKKTILGLIVVLLVTTLGFAREEKPVVISNYLAMSLIGETSLDLKVFLLRQNIYQLRATQIFIQDLLAYRQARGQNYDYAPLDGNALSIPKSDQPGALDFNNQNSFDLGRQLAKTYYTMNDYGELRFARLRYAFYTMIKQIANTGKYANDMAIDRRAFKQGVEYVDKNFRF